MDFEELINKAKLVLNPRRLSPSCQVATVSAAVQTVKGNIYVGVCIDTACSLGFCAEHSAIAAMITNGESEIQRVVAINANFEILAPCGRCRELMYQINNTNVETMVLLPGYKEKKLGEIFPYTQ